MSDNKLKPWKPYKVRTDDGTLHSEHGERGSAESIRGVANSRAEALGIATRYVVSHEVSE